MGGESHLLVVLVHKNIEMKKIKGGAEIVPRNMEV